MPHTVRHQRSMSNWTWRYMFLHIMMTYFIKWKFSMLLHLYEGNPLVTSGFPSQRPMTRRFNVFFDLHLNKRLIKQSRRRWFETPRCSLWRHCNVLYLYAKELVNQWFRQTRSTVWLLMSWLLASPGARFNIKMPSDQYRKSHCGDKTVVRSSYLHSGISYTGKMVSLYWIPPPWSSEPCYWICETCWFSLPSIRQHLNYLCHFIVTILNISTNFHLKIHTYISLNEFRWQRVNIPGNLGKYHACTFYKAHPLNDQTVGMETWKSLQAL